MWMGREEKKGKKNLKFSVSRIIGEMNQLIGWRISFRIPEWRILRNCSFYVVSMRFSVVRLALYALGHRLVVVVAAVVGVLAVAVALHVRQVIAYRCVALSDSKMIVVDTIRLLECYAMPSNQSIQAFFVCLAVASHAISTVHSHRFRHTLMEIHAVILPAN